MIKSFFYYSEFNNHKGLQKFGVSLPIQLIKMLKKGRLDLAIGSRLVLLSEINKHFPDLKNDFEIIQPSVSSQPVFNIVSRSNPNHEKIVSDFNRGLKAVQDDGTLDKIMKFHGF